MSLTGLFAAALRSIANRLNPEMASPTAAMPIEIPSVPVYIIFGRDMYEDRCDQFDNIRATLESGINPIEITELVERNAAFVKLAYETQKDSCIILGLSVNGRDRARAVATNLLGVEITRTACFLPARQAALIPDETP